MNSNRYKQMSSEVEKALHAAAVLALAASTDAIYARVYREQPAISQREMLDVQGDEQAAIWCETCRVTVGGNARNHQRLGHRVTP